MNVFVLALSAFGICMTAVTLAHIVAISGLVCEWMISAVRVYDFVALKTIGVTDVQRSRSGCTN